MVDNGQNILDMRVIVSLWDETGETWHLALPRLYIGIRYHQWSRSSIPRYLISPNINNTNTFWLKIPKPHQDSVMQFIQGFCIVRDTYPLQDWLGLIYLTVCTRLTDKIRYASGFESQVQKTRFLIKAGWIHFYEVNSLYKNLSTICNSTTKKF